MRSIKWSAKANAAPLKELESISFSGAAFAFADHFIERIEALEEIMRSSETGIVQWFQDIRPRTLSVIQRRDRVKEVRETASHIIHGYSELVIEMKMRMVKTKDGDESEMAAALNKTEIN